jgi:hypothetical protein
LTTLKIAVLAPIPRARVSTTTAVKPGVFRIVRRQYRMFHGRFKANVVSTRQSCDSRAPNGEATAQTTIREHAYGTFRCSERQKTSREVLY